MMAGSITRVPFDVESYSRRSRTGPCFICAIVSRDPAQPEEIVYDDGEHIAEASVPCERTYLLSLGSQQGNAHLHWHVAALPPGVPYEQQQYHALMAEHGIIEHTPEEAAALAATIRSALDA